MPQLACPSPPIRFLLAALVNLDHSEGGVVVRTLECALIVYVFPCVVIHCRHNYWPQNREQPPWPPTMVAVAIPPPLTTIYGGYGLLCAFGLMIGMLLMLFWDKKIITTTTTTRWWIPPCAAVDHQRPRWQWVVLT